MLFGVLPSTSTRGSTYLAPRDKHHPVPLLACLPTLREVLCSGFEIHTVSQRRYFSSETDRYTASFRERFERTDRQQVKTN